MMQFVSVCAGIEAASVAWKDLFKARAVVERDAFPSAVLEYRHPGVPNLGDMTKWREWDEAILLDADILVGGTPCQAFSVAGLRNSLADDRGNLSLEFVRLADAIDAARLDAGKQPAVIVWENVPGVLSVKDNAFGSFLAGLAGEDTALIPAGGKWTDAGVVDGPSRSIAWRVLDAQFFALAQRRRRVFVVASSRAGFDPAAVLLEWEGVRRDTPPRREAGQGFAHPVAPCLTSGGRGVERTGETRGQDPVVAVPSTGDISHCLNAGGMGRQDYETETLIAHTLKGEGFDASEDGTGRGAPRVPVAYRTTGNDGVCETGDPVHALTTATDPNSHVLTQPVAVPLQEVGKRTGVSTDDPRAGIGIGKDGDPMFTLQAGAQHGVAAEYYSHDYCQDRIYSAEGVSPALNCSQDHKVRQSMAVRRLTPVECERLQGFPDNYTQIPWRGKPAADCPDGPRYKALGNSMAVPVMAWIGKRISEHINREEA